MQNSHVNAVEEAIHYMRDHLDENITTEQLASLVGYSTYHFTRMFKSVTGVSPRLYLSALRIESSKEELLNESTSLMRTLLSVGFSSMGTFNSRFKQFVGLPPRKFQLFKKTLSNYINELQYKNMLQPTSEKYLLPRIVCKVEAPASFNGIIFVGLFPRPIPDQKPITGTALYQGNRVCVFSNVPKGTYFVLAAGVPWSLNPKSYFLLDQSLRAKYETPIQVTDTSHFQINLHLRDKQPCDPPILVNLPHLLFEQDQK